MTRLNAPRTVPYAFHVVEIDDWAWLFDDSERTYVCSAQPMIWAEPLYSVDCRRECDRDHEYPDPGYFAESAKTGAVPIPIDPDDSAPDVPRDQAWDAAREEAQANHRI